MRLSVLIPCYNAERWIGQAIRSALAQTWPDKEVIVVDDGSTDGSLAAIRAFGNAIRWETGPNRGGNVARNRLLELAAGEWLQYLDADDYLLPEKAAGQMAALPAGGRAADVIYSPVTLEHCRDGLPPETERLPIPEPHDPWILLARWFLPQTGAALWRREALAGVGGWKADQPCCQEHELYLRLLMAGRRLAYSPAGGAVYRQWSQGTVCRKNPLQSFLRRLEVVRRAEEHLRQRNELTAERRQAIAHARLECARSVYPLDRAAAASIVAEARRAAPGFRLPADRPFPRPYRVLYRWLGFAAAERVAQAVRGRKARAGS